MEINQDSNKYLIIRELKQYGSIVSFLRNDENNGRGYIRSSIFSENLNFIFKGSENGKIKILDLKNFKVFGM